LKDRLSQGEAGDVFASCRTWATRSPSPTPAGQGPPSWFARNHLCALLRPGLKATPATLLAMMLDPSIKIGTSTPKNDPGGDYAWAMFQKGRFTAAGQPSHARSQGAQDRQRARIAGRSPECDQCRGLGCSRKKRVVDIFFFPTAPAALPRPRSFRASPSFPCRRRWPSRHTYGPHRPGRARNKDQAGSVCALHFVARGVKKFWRNTASTRPRCPKTLRPQHQSGPITCVQVTAC